MGHCTVQLMTAPCADLFLLNVFLLNVFIIFGMDVDLFDGSESL